MYQRSPIITDFTMITIDYISTYYYPVVRLIKRVMGAELEVAKVSFLVMRIFSRIVHRRGYALILIYSEDIPRGRASPDHERRQAESFEFRMMVIDLWSDRRETVT